MSLFPRFVQNDFAPMFRLMDDYANFTASKNNGFTHALRSFQPRFDVKENKDGYELSGELPGVEQKDINIEFTDATTLTIKGRSESSHEEGTRPSTLVEGQTDQAKLQEADGSSYHKATVEDENDTRMASTGESETTQADETPTPATTAATEEIPEPKTRYWLSERASGQFARTFTFANRVDQDNVKASLKNGILSVVVPKAAAPVSKRINVE